MAREKRASIGDARAAQEDLLGDRWSRVRDGRADVGVPLAELYLDVRTPVGILERVADDVAHGFAPAALRASSVQQETISWNLAPIA